MIGFLLGLLLGAVVAFLGPSLLPQQMRSALTDTGLRIVGALAILFADRKSTRLNSSHRL